MIEHLKQLFTNEHLKQLFTNKIFFMKKIGVLHGKERSFPEALVERINSKNVVGIVAEPVKIDMVAQGEPTEYAVIFDRISQDVPFYRAYLKNAALCGTAVINNRNSCNQQSFLVECR